MHQQDKQFIGRVVRLVAYPFIGMMGGKWLYSLPTDQALLVITLLIVCTFVLLGYKIGKAK
jgi:hypothetical protein